MEAHNILFWLSLGSGGISLCAVALYRFTRSEPSKNSPQATDLPTHPK